MCCESRKFNAKHLFKQQKINAITFTTLPFEKKEIRNNKVKLIINCCSCSHEIISQKPSLTSSHHKRRRFHFLFSINWLSVLMEAWKWQRRAREKNYNKLITVISLSAAHNVKLGQKHRVEKLKFIQSAVMGEKFCLGVIFS